MFSVIVHLRSVQLLVVTRESGPSGFFNGTHGEYRVVCLLFNSEDFMHIFGQTTERLRSKPY